MGVTPSDSGAVGADLHGVAPTSSVAGFLASTTGDIRRFVQNYVCETQDYQWREVKGNSYKFTGGLSFQLIALLQHSITLGFKTTADLHMSDTFTVGRYACEMLGAKYELIRPSKDETDWGRKKERVIGWLNENVVGGEIHRIGKKAGYQQAEYKRISKELAKKAGAKLEETVQKWTEKIDKSRQRVDEVTAKISGELKVEVQKMKKKVREMEAEAKKLEKQCAQYERKMNQMKLAVDASLEIKSDKSSLTGKMADWQASTMKFMGRLVKLGE